jgi:hypothetical protein
MSNIITRDQILGAQDIQTEEVKVPEWGGSVLVKGMTGAERDKFEASNMEGKGKKQKFNLENLRAKLVAKSVVDEKGDHLFQESDIPALGKKSASALERVFSVAMRINGISADDVEELTKN